MVGRDLRFRRMYQSQALSAGDRRGAFAPPPIALHTPRLERGTGGLRDHCPAPPVAVGGSSDPRRPRSPDDGPHSPCDSRVFSSSMLPERPASPTPVSWPGSSRWSCASSHRWPRPSTASPGTPGISASSPSVAGSRPTLSTRPSVTPTPVSPSLWSIRTRRSKPPGPASRRVRATTSRSIRSRRGSRTRW